MTDFNRKVEETTARVSKTVSEAAERLEKDSAELIDYLNREVMPAVRQKSTKALRVAAEKLQRLADYMDEARKSQAEDSKADKP
jgi:translation initiation factor 2 beta subunit (eIF-2beta)/eIF-5